MPPPGGGPLKPGYVLAGDELFLQDRCRAAVLKAFVPPDFRDFCLSDLDLGIDTSSSTFSTARRRPSLMAPFQVIFVRNVRNLYTRGAKKDEFAALDRYFKSPNPAGADRLCRRFHAHPVGCAPHGHGRQEPVRAPHGDAGRALRDGGTGAGERRRRHALGECHRAGGGQPPGSRCGARTGGCAGRRHDDDRVGAGKAAALHAGARQDHSGRRGDHGAGRQAALAL